MSQHPDVLILGGGVIGLTVAYSLARENIRVEIVDRDDFGQEASWAGAGIIPPGNPASARTPFDRLRALSSEAFPALSRELRERTGIDNGYLRCGGLVIPEDHEDADDQEWRGEGIRCEELTASEVRLLEPNLAAGSGRALHLPDTAQLRNPRHVKALVAGCASLGVRLRPGCPAVGLVCGDQVTGVTTIEGRLTAGHYVIASGAWSDSLLGQVGWRPGIRPVRGQIALLNTGAPLIRRVLMHGKRYVVPRPDGRVLVGATEEDVGFDKRTTAAAIRDLLDFAISLVPGLADAPLERSWAGLRPGSPDGLPFLGRVPGVANLFVAAGHFRAGIQLSPGTATLMTELILGRPPTIPLDAFRLDR